MANPPVLPAHNLLSISSPSKLWSAKGQGNDLNIPQQAADLLALSNASLFAPKNTPSVLLNNPLNILKILLKDVVRPEAIWPEMLPICVWGWRGCVIGRVSKSDHPPEGVWLTLSSPQTPVWDPGVAAAGLRENLAVVITSAEVLGTQQCWCQQMWAFSCTLQIKCNWTQHDSHWHVQTVNLCV